MQTSIEVFPNNTTVSESVMYMLSLLRFVYRNAIASFVHGCVQLKLMLVRHIYLYDFLCVVINGM